MDNKKNIIRFYDDKNELLKNNPLFIIADESIGLEYFQLVDLDDDGNEFEFKKYIWDLEKGEYYSPDERIKSQNVSESYNSDVNYVIAFDVLWENSKGPFVDELLEKMVNLILKSERIKGIIVYTRMGAINQVNSMREKLKGWLKYCKDDKEVDDSYKVNDRFIKIGTTDPYMNINSLGNLAKKILDKTKGEKP